MHKVTRFIQKRRLNRVCVLSFRSFDFGARASAQDDNLRLPPKPSVATGCLHTGMTEASGKDSEGVPKGNMTVQAFLDMTADDRKVVR